MKLLLFMAVISILANSCYSQQSGKKMSLPQITLANSIKYTDSSFTDLPGNGFLIDIGNEVLAVTCKHVFWENRSKSMKNISFNGALQEWRMVVLNDPSQYLILGELLNSDENEAIGERNTDGDYLVFKTKENHSAVKPLKLSLVSAQRGDTLSKVGWSFNSKKSAAEPRICIAESYSGSSLLLTNIVQQNYAGLSGSPVINQNYELMAIVSSWKYDMFAKNWYEAACSTDYLWQVLYSYYLNKYDKEKSILTFQDFLKDYGIKNGGEPQVSAYLYTELFYRDWLNSKDIKYSSMENYSQWTADLYEKYGIKLICDSYRKSLLIFDNWKEQYILNKSDLDKLEIILRESSSFLPAYIDFCEFALELSDLKEFDKAIDVLNFANRYLPNMGQVDAFLGDVYLAQGKKELAKNAYLKCLESFPNYPQAVNGLTKL